MEYFFRDEEIMTIDLHKMEKWEAIMALNYAIENAGCQIREVVVIHGYHQGSMLLNMVRKDYKNRRVMNKFVGLNQGRTSLILKKSEVEF